MAYGLLDRPSRRKPSSVDPDFEDRQDSQRALLPYRRSVGRAAVTGSETRNGRRRCARARSARARRQDRSADLRRADRASVREGRRHVRRAGHPRRVGDVHDRPGEQLGRRATTTVTVRRRAGSRADGRRRTSPAHRRRARHAALRLREARRRRDRLRVVPHDEGRGDHRDDRPQPRQGTDSRSASATRESIVDPNKEIVSGYSANVMPTNYGTALTEPGARRARQLRLPQHQHPRPRPRPTGEPGNDHEHPVATGTRGRSRDERRPAVERLVLHRVLPPAGETSSVDPGFTPGSRRTRPFHARGSAAHPGSAGWRAPPPRRPASRTPVRSPRHGSSGPPPPSPGP